MFKPVLSAAEPLQTRKPRFRLSRRTISWILATVVALDVLFLLFGPGSALWWRVKSKSELTQQVSVTIQHVNANMRSIRVVGDLVGIMGVDVIVPPEAWIGIDRRQAAFGELRHGLRATIFLVLDGERRVARWIAATSGQSPGAPEMSAPPSSPVSPTASPSSSR